MPNAPEQRPPVEGPRTPFHWPNWVPEKVRAEVERFWTCFGRNGGDDWRENAARNDAPALGERVALHELCEPADAPPTAEGRFVFAWNNIGRVVTDNERICYVSFGPGWRQGQVDFAARREPAASLPVERGAPEASEEAIQAKIAHLRTFPQRARESEESLRQQAIIALRLESHPAPGRAPGEASELTLAERLRAFRPGGWDHHRNCRSRSGFECSCGLSEFRKLVRALPTPDEER